MGAGRRDPHGRGDGGAGLSLRHLVIRKDLEGAHQRRVVHVLQVLNELDASLDRFEVDRASGALVHRQTIPELPPGFSGDPWAAEIRLTPDGRFLYTSERRSSTIAGSRWTRTTAGSRRSANPNWVEAIAPGPA